MNNSMLDQTNKYSIAIDIGTSTIKAYLIKNQNIPTKDFHLLPSLIEEEIEEKNAQYLYGKDVISRVMYAHYKGIEKLQESIIFQISALIKRLSQNQKKITSITITGNSVMLSILEGFSLKGFEQFPFKSPSFFGYYTKNLKIYENIEIYLPPAIAAFLGSDALCAVLFAYLFVKSIQEAKQEPLTHNSNSSKLKNYPPFLVVDIGTNGEILLWKENSITATSCAAGPAFEGKNLSRQISGSMAVNYLSKMITSGVIDKTGLIIEPKTSSPLSQEDIRQLQLAKAAIAAGIETLLTEDKVNINEIKNCFICGNFGKALEEDDLINIGLLPKEFSGKIKHLGNGAGFGALALSKKENVELVKKIASQSKIIELGGNPLFNEKYLNHMNFNINI